MMDMEDSELLREFAERGSDPAFTTLVHRYADLVYSTALRQLRDPHLSQEVTQTVFRPGNEAEVFFAPKSDSSRRRLPFLNAR